MAYKVKTNVGQLKSQFNASIWSFSGTKEQSYPEKIHHWVSKSKKSLFTLTFFKLENIAPVIFSYNEKLAASYIKHVLSIITKILKGCDIIYIDVDKFIILNDVIVEEQHYNQMMNNISLKIKDYGATLEKAPIYLAAKSGTVFFTKDEKIPSVLNKAYMALYEAKKNFYANNHCIFSEHSEYFQECKAQMHMASYFLDAIEHKRLQLAFQPVVSATTGNTVSYEALLRIVTLEGEIISAGPFIPIAEKFGFIDLIDNMVLQLVVKELTLDANIVLAMNLSNQTVSDAKWLNIAKKLLGDSKIASRLIVELTETSVEYNLKKVSFFVDTIKALGCKVAIDDFGAGYTSFKQLKCINVDILKIDGSFVRDIVENPDSKLFVKTLLEFSRAYKLTTVAEYVETGEIAKLLMELGVDTLQGYYFAHPYNHRPWIKENHKK